MSFVLPLTSAGTRPSPGRRAFRAMRIVAATPAHEGPSAKPAENGGVKPKTTTLPSPSKPPPTPAPPAVKVVSKEAAPVAKQPPKPVTAKPAPAAKTFTNQNIFVVPVELRVIFDKIWKERKDLMEASDGFVELKITDGLSHRAGREVTIASTWSSIPQWEAYACSEGARRSHLPHGIYQCVPKKGEGFPEDFTPFVDYSNAVNAKY